MLREKIASIGKTVTKEDYASVLIALLPPSYDAMISSMAMSCDISEAAVTPDLVIRHMTDKYQKRLIKKNANGGVQDESFATGTHNNKNKRNIECFNCHKKGHMKAECWAKGSGKEGQGPKRRQGSAQEGAAAASDETNDTESWAAMEYSQNEVSNMLQTTNRVETELYDSGASRHMSPFWNKFITYQQISPRPIVAANNQVFYAVGTGDLKVQVPNRATSTPILLQDALHMPDMGLMVVSIGRIANAGYSVAFEGNACNIKNKKGTLIGKVPSTANGLYKVKQVYVAVTEPEQVDLYTLHRRLGHIAPNTICKLIKDNIITGIQLINKGPKLTCPSCEYAKATRKPIKKECMAPLMAAFGEEVHTDLWAPAPVTTISGHKYYTSFTDDHT
jgi:GAG-pre-integrase domain